MFFSKKEQIVKTAQGAVIPLAEVKDEVFSQGMMGQGFGIQPISGEVVSPITGTVEAVFPTKHAITLKSKKGLEVLVHIGIDTVELNGVGIDVQVKPGDKVKAGELLAKVDLAQIKAAGKGTDVITVFPNLAEEQAALFDLGSKTEVIAEW